MNHSTLASFAVLSLSLAACVDAPVSTAAQADTSVPTVQICVTPTYSSLTQTTSYAVAITGIDFFTNDTIDLNIPWTADYGLVGGVSTTTTTTDACGVLRGLSGSLATFGSPITLVDHDLQQSYQLSYANGCTSTNGFTGALPDCTNTGGGGGGGGTGTGGTSSGPRHHAYE